MHYIHCITLHYIALHCIALHYMHYIHCIHYIHTYIAYIIYIALHCIALHYITLHYIHIHMHFLRPKLPFSHIFIIYIYVCVLDLNISSARLTDLHLLQLHDEYQGGCEPRSLSHGHLGDDPTGGDLVHHRVHLPGLALVEGMGGSWGSSVREIVGCKLEQKDQSCLL